MSGSVYDRALGGLQAGDAAEAQDRYALRFDLNTWKRVAVAVAKNIAMGIPFIREARVRRGRTIAVPPSKAGLALYAYGVVDAVARHSGAVAGKRILEIGPGDNLVSGLAFLASGAASYTAVDRFPGPYADEQARRWYAALRDDWGDRGLWPADLDPCTFPMDRRVSVVPEGVEEARARGTHDVVCSYVVGEHVSDPAAFAAFTRRSLAPGGVAVHVIDFRGHEWDNEADPLLFLRFPDWLWRMMGSNRGCPNRVRFETYRRIFERHDLIVTVPQRRYFARTGHTAQATFVMRHRPPPRSQ